MFRRNLLLFPAAAVVGFLGGKLAAVAPWRLGQPQAATAHADNDDSQGEYLAHLTTDQRKAPSRQACLDKLKQANAQNPLDLLVIGGGATGTGAVLDAASRGMSVGLVERDDFSSGTSSRSTKLLHGGVRYLEAVFKNLEVGKIALVFEALRERSTVINMAPHLSFSLPIITPCYSYFELAYYRAGLLTYDLVAGTRQLHRSRYMSTTRTVEKFPMLARTSDVDGRKLRGSIMYFDGSTNDARLCVSLALTAAAMGAAVTNHTEVVALLTSDGVGDGTGSGGSGRVCGARVRDTLTGDEFPVYAKVVLNATGPFVDALRQHEVTAVEAAKPTETAMSNFIMGNFVRPSSGVHIILPDFYSPDGLGLIIPKTRDGRVVFMLPWEGKTIAGTTDAPCPLSALPVAHDDEVGFILDAISRYLLVKVRKEDVCAAWSGIRPLAVDPASLGSSDTSTAALSRNHVVHTGPGKMVTVTGGKWTTFRVMAKDAVDACVALLDKPTQDRLTPSATEHQTLIGAEGWDPALFARLSQGFSRKKQSRWSSSLVVGQMHSDIAKYLSHSYGSNSIEVAQLADQGYGKRLAHNFPFIEAEVIYCVHREMAMTAMDILARRTRLAFLDEKAARQALPRVVELMGREFQWSSARQKQEIASAHEFLDTMKPVKRLGHSPFEEQCGKFC